MSPKIQLPLLVPEDENENNEKKEKHEEMFGVAVCLDYLKGVKEQKPQYKPDEKLVAAALEYLKGVEKQKQLQKASEKKKTEKEKQMHNRFAFGKFACGSFGKFAHNRDVIDNVGSDAPAGDDIG